MDIRLKQQEILSYAVYDFRMRCGLDSGSSEGDWSMANKILNHFEKPYKDIEWLQEEEDFSEYRQYLIKEYIKYMEAERNGFERDSCGD